MIPQTNGEPKMSKLYALPLILMLGCSSSRQSVDFGAGSTGSGNVASFYVEALHQNDILVLGESHRNLRIVKNFNQILKDFEDKYPGQLGLVGLEVFSVYQPEVERFLETDGPEADDILINTPDREALRGTRDELGPDGRKNIVSPLFLDVYKTIKAINSKRASANKIRIIAVDRHPPEDTTFRDYQKNHWEDGKLAEWGAGRDEHMFEQLQGPLRTLPNGMSAVIYIGSAHAQHSGMEIVTIPKGVDIKGPLRIKWLATRLVEGFPDAKVVSAEQIAPGNALCEDIEAKLSADGLSEPMAFDLRSSPLGEMVDFRCKEFPIDRSTVAFDPPEYKAKEHFDFYTY
jgi:hypothetical protein